VADAVCAAQRSFGCTPLHYPSCPSFLSSRVLLTSLLILCAALWIPARAWAVCCATVCCLLPTWPQCPATHFLDHGELGFAVTHWTRRSYFDNLVLSNELGFAVTHWTRRSYFDNLVLSSELGFAVTHWTRRSYFDNLVLSNDCADSLQRLLLAAKDTHIQFGGLRQVYTRSLPPRCVSSLTLQMKRCRNT
jgi:hypothetical protein